MLQYLHSKHILIMQKRNTLFAHLLCLSLSALTLTFASCGIGNGTPKGLAEEACDCWQEMKTLENNTAQARKADECFGTTQRALSELREMGVAKGWTDEQVRQAEREFDSVYDACSKRKGDSGSSSTETSSVTEQPYTTGAKSEYQREENASAPIEAEEPKIPKTEASAPVATANAEVANDDNEIVRSKYVPNLFGEFGETATFKGKVGKLSANYTLVLREDQQVEGTYSYVGRKQLYSLKGRMDEGDGSITLTEYTDGKATATCELVAEGSCYVGRMNNTDGRAFTMNMCAQE
ncbi:hypothetical protein [Hymenobacter frigidus]|nr:hypothetical protein [Hymenobacter frigidus]